MRAGKIKFGHLGKTKDLVADEFILLEEGCPLQLQKETEGPNRLPNRQS
jgi:hypothetical protein